MIDLQISGQTAKLSPNLILMLDIHPRNCIIIEYDLVGDIFVPLIRKVSNGYVVTQKGTFILRGREREFLTQFGQEFSVSQFKNNCAYLVSTDKFEQKEKQSKAPVENYLDLSILQDTNYHIDKFSKYEL